MAQSCRQFGTTATRQTCHDSPGRGGPQPGRGGPGREAAPRIGGSSIRSEHDLLAPRGETPAGPLNGLVRRTMNRLHLTTREEVLRGELLFEGGDPYDPDGLDETERNLRRLGILNDVAATPSTPPPTARSTCA